MKAKTNIKVMTKPELTDEEIQSHMDFNKLLQTYRQNGPTNTISKWLVFSGLSVAIIALVSTAVYFYSQNSSPNLDHSNPSKPHDAVDTTLSIKESKAIQPPPKKNEVKTEKSTTREPAIVSKKNPPKDSIINKKLATQEFAEAAPIEGYPSLYAYFDKELKYPIAPADSIQGIVTVSFAITKTGKPDLIKIENSLGEAFDAECIRVIQNMPSWRPATVNGKPVQTRLSIPLTFKIKK